MDLKTFNELVESDNRHVIVLSASWCAPCVMLGKTIDKIRELASNLSDRIYKFDIDDCGDLVDHFSVQSVPTIFYVGGGIIDIKKGIQSEEQLCDWLMG
jgi:thioredoxin 1